MNPEAAHGQTQPATTETTYAASPNLKSILDEILKETRFGRTDQQSKNFESLIAEFARQINANRMDLRLAGDLRIMIAHRIKEIVDDLAKQIDLIIHHPSFQKLESSWLSLRQLVETTTIADDVIVKVLNTSRRDLEKDLKTGSETSVVESGLFEKVFRDTYNTFGGVPFGVLVGDFEFSHEPSDVSNNGLLTKLTSVAAAAHAPLIAAASPKMFGWNSFEELAGARNLNNIFREDAAYDAWRAFRKSEESRYTSLCLPHVLMRLPYGAGGEVVDAFDYRETVDGPTSEKFLWGNAAYALAGLMAESFADFGWCVSICGPEGGGLVTQLPLHTFQTELGDNETKCPTEIKISNDRDYALTQLGFTPIVHRTGDPKDEAVFNDVPSCHLPDKHLTAEAQANAFLGAKLPYMMAASRIAHFLKKKGDEKIGAVTSREQFEKELNEWIKNYVDPRDDFDKERRRKYPLRRAQILVEDVPGRPGFYTARAYIQPHFKLEGLNVTVSLVADLGPQQGQ